MLEDHDVPDFGYLLFDHYVTVAWDPNSTLSKQEQKRSLVDKWVRLGKYERKKYFQESLLDGDPIPAHVPQDLLSREERAVNGQISGSLFIRTWFGERDNQASQDAADTAYKRLFLYVMQQGDPDCFNDCIDEDFIFDNKDELFSDQDTENPDIVDGIALGTPGSVPSYLITALMHCPDQFDGVRIEDQYNDSPRKTEDQEKRQNLLVLVADRKACETGWVLHLAVNHKGEILPFRIREEARSVTISVGCWMDGQALVENAVEPDVDWEFYMPRADGWA